MLALLSLGASAALASPAADSVTSLPGYGTPPTPQWSGFLDSGVEIAKGGKATLHYWLASAEVAPETAPVVLWLNGGPGSSSILGMLQEHGPLIINATGGLSKNPYAWTTLVNLLILESPAGVGYSYCEASLSGGGCENNDNTTAAAARGALSTFFSTKFPELKANDFFITGESYAGVYVPTLAREILDNAPEINIKGLAVGDPCTDNVAQRDSMDMLWYGHKNGFVPEAEYNFLWNNCSARHPNSMQDGAWGSAAAAKKTKTSKTRFTMRSDASPACVLAQRKYLASSSKGFSQGWPLAWINDLTLFGPAAVVPFTAPGSLNYMTAQWMMSPAVKAALHVTTSPSKAWPGPQPDWGYTSNWAACNGAAPPGTDSMINFYRYIAPKLRTTIVFNGDTDPCVSYEGTRQAIKEVGFAEIVGGAYRPWFFNATASTVEFLATKPLLFGPALALIEGGAQFAGHVVNYEQNLSFVTVHGSGHMVPQFRPRVAHKLLSNLISGRAFAAPLSSDASLAAMTDAAFDAFLDTWTTSAKADL